jgi:hypothetical protein
MSHSTTLVIIGQAEDAADAERQAEEMLAPFDEELEVEPYRSYERISEPSKFWYHKELVTKHGPIDDFATLARLLNQEWPDEGKYGADENGLYQMSTYNPKSKWDWYSLGGRWTGFFMVKAGVMAASAVGLPGVLSKPAQPGTADLLRKRDVDFDMMRRENEIDAEKRWADWQKVLASVPEPERKHTGWGAVRDAHPDEIDKARQIYHDQPIVKAMRDPQYRDLFGWTEDPESFFFGRDDDYERWIRQAIEGTAVPFSVLDSEGWHERGEMGWWGMVSNEKDRDEWNASIAQMYDNLPDDAWLALFDLHI